MEKALFCVAVTDLSGTVIYQKFFRNRLRAYDVHEFLCARYVAARYAVALRREVEICE